MLSNENQTRYGMRFNVDYQIRDWAKIGSSTSLTYTIKNSRGKNIFTKSLTAFPLGEPYDANGNINVNYIEGETSPLVMKLKTSMLTKRVRRMPISMLMWN